MKRSVQLGWLLVLSGCSLAVAATSPVPRPDPLDDIISAMRRGERRSTPYVDQEVIQKTMATASVAERNALTDDYLVQVKASIIDIENHGGWPCRSWLVYQTTPRRKVTLGLKSRFDRAPDPIVAYAVICPALYARDDELLNRALAFLEKNDPFLHQRANEQMKSFWMPFIAETLKKQTPSMTSKQTKAEKDDPFTQLPKY